MRSVLATHKWASLEAALKENKALKKQLAELRDAALEYSYNGHSPHCKVINISVNLIKCNCGYDKLAALLQEKGE